MKKFYSALLIVLMVVGLSSSEANSQDYIPPAGSPMALHQHPRLFLTGDQLAPTRDYINDWYSTEFQQFVDEMDSVYDGLLSSTERAERISNAINFSFLYLIDPGQMSGYNFGHSREEYRQRALADGISIANDHDLREGHGSGSISSLGGGGFVNLGIAVVYDWLYPTLTLSEKQTLADGMIWRFDNRDSNSNPDERIQLSNHELAFNHVASGGLATWGDPLGAAYEQKAQEMLNHYRDMFISRTFDVSTYVMEGSSSWGEGQNYYFLSYHLIAWMASAAGPATGTNWFEECSFLHYHVWSMFYRLNPYPYEGENYFARSDVVDFAETQNIGVTRMVSHAVGALKNDDPDMAAMGKWYIDNFGVSMDSDPRLYSVIYYFLNGYKDVQAKSPDELNMPKMVRLGLGETVMRSDFSQDATSITFWAPKIFLTAHAHYDNASFTIDKFGPLALDAGNGKSGDGILPKSNSTSATIYHNVLGVYHPDDLYSGFNGMWQFLDVSSSFDDPDDDGFQEGGDNHVGTVSGMDHVDQLYSYVNYDYTRSYKGDGRVTQARRQLLYLRAPDESNPADQEFVLINDRMNTANTSFEKRWLLHVGFEPELTDGSWNSVSDGWWESTDGSTVKITNTFSDYHGRMFMKVLFPESHKLMKIGGDGHWFDDADGRDMSDGGVYDDLGAAWCGSYRIETRPLNNDTYHNMLHIIQVGDANTLQQMAPVTRLSGGNFVGAFVNQNRVAVFSNSENLLTNVSYSISGTNPVTHIIADLQPFADITVTRNGQTIFNGNAKGGGSLSFTDNPGGTATYQVAVTGTSVEEGTGNVRPEKFRLDPNYPNPFNPSTEFQYAIAQPSLVRIKVHNTAGQLIRILENNILEAGNYRAHWDGRNQAGAEMPSGMYLITMAAGKFKATRKALLIR